MTIRLLIADDQEVARNGLRQFVSGTEIEVAGEAADARGAVEMAVAEGGPDVVLMAIHLPGGDGLAALDRIRQARPELPVILTAHEDNPIYFVQARGAGAAGLLPKQASRDAVVEAIRSVAAGQQLWDRANLRRMAGAGAAPAAGLEAPLTRREVEVLRGVSEGLTNVQIGRQLQISSETVKEHVQHILRKIGVSDRTQAAVWAVRKGIA